MRIEWKDDLNLRMIAESGQCFRWEYDPETDEYRIPYRDQVLYIREVSGEDSSGCHGDAAAARTLETSAGNLNPEAAGTSEEEEDVFRRVWRPYFDMDRSYSYIRRRIRKKEDPVMFEAAKAGTGIRILRQDPFEMLITFIISQRKNIPAIRHAVELLCRAAGPAKRDCRGRSWHMFPEAAAIAGMSGAALDSCRLGYRDKYVRGAAEVVASGGLDLAELSKEPAEACVSELKRLYGVGQKVADCVALFGLHKLDAFPKDVWIERVLHDCYDDSRTYPAAAYSPYNGVMQQYLFEWYRHRGR